MLFYQVLYWYKHSQAYVGCRFGPHAMNIMMPEELARKKDMAGRPQPKLSDRSLSLIDLSQREGPSL